MNIFSFSEEVCRLHFKEGFSSKEIQKQLGLKRYEPVGAIVHKLRKAIGKKTLCIL